MKKIINILLVISILLSLCTVTGFSASAYKDVFVVSNTSLSSIISAGGNLNIKGSTPSVVITLPSTVSLSGNLKIDNAVLSGESTIYANGYSLEIGENITSDSRLTVYGGKKSAACGSTDLKIYGGLYTYIFGGGHGGAVNGNTNVVVGGNVNAGDNINDSSSSVSPCRIFGGGNSGNVSGKTNVTLEGNAVTKYIVGAGNSGTAPDTNIYIKGGKVMNVYAGSLNTALTNCNTHITMTGGMAEALFGGCEAVTMSGNTHITLLGGEVTRRVYGGCYNDWKITWSSSRYVTGTTTIAIGPDVKLNTKTGLSSDNSLNVGVHAGSRCKSNQSAEVNTIIYLDDCYSAQKSKVMPTSGLLQTFKSHTDYVVKASKGGKVYCADKSGKMLAVPDKGKYAKVNGGAYINEEFSLSSSTTEVTFADNIIINSVSASKNQNTASIKVDFASVNIRNEKTPCIYAGVYEGNKLVGVGKYAPSTTDNSKTFTVALPGNSSGKYTVKAMMMDENGKPLCDAVTTEI